MGIKALEPWKSPLKSQLLGAAKEGAYEKLGKATQPYPGALTTPYEEQGLSTLGQYLGSPLPTEGGLFAGAQGELEKTFGGEYDPVGGTYYQAYRTAVMRELQEAKDRLAAETSSRDAYFGGGRIAETGRLEEGATNTLALELGRLFEGERGRRLEAVPMAQNLMGFQEQVPQQRVAASQELGKLPFQREYGEYMRQMQELGIPLETAVNLLGQQGEYYSKSKGGSDAGAIAPYALAALMFMSDENMKENMVPIEDALGKVNELKGLTYNYVFKDKDDRDAGVIAQDVEAILPEAVTEKDGIKYVKADALMALLVNAVNELSEIVERKMV